MVRVLNKVVVIGGRSRQDRVVGQVRGESLAFPVGQNVEHALGLGLDGQDAFDGIKGKGAEATGVLQGGEQVGEGVDALQR